MNPWWVFLAFYMGLGIGHFLTVLSDHPSPEQPSHLTQIIWGALIGTPLLVFWLWDDIT